MREGRIVLVAGAWCGIGRGLALASVREGNSVVVNYRPIAQKPRRPDGRSRRQVVGIDGCMATRLAFPKPGLADLS